MMELLLFGSWVCLAAGGILAVSIGLWIVNRGEATRSVRAATRSVNDEHGDGAGT
jgi:hypothetical protein